MEYVHGSRVRDDGCLVVELQDGLASNIHHEGVDARHVVRHARVGGLPRERVADAREGAAHASR